MPTILQCFFFFLAKAAQVGTAAKEDESQGSGCDILSDIFMLCCEQKIYVCYLS